VTRERGMNPARAIPVVTQEGTSLKSVMSQMLGLRLGMMAR
jgi:hypothetical protein